MSRTVKHDTKLHEVTACEIESVEQNWISLNTFHDHTVLPRPSGLCGWGVPNYQGFPTTGGISNISRKVAGAIPDGVTGIFH
jgi:hypothetical protein